MSCTRGSPNCPSRSRETASYSYNPCCALVVDLMCHSISSRPRACATSCASTVLPVPGSPFTSSGRCNVTAALTATSRSRDAMYRSVLLKEALTLGSLCIRRRVSGESEEPARWKGTELMPRSRPYGFWLSPITSELIVAESIDLSGTQFDGDSICWTEGRPREQGRSVVVQYRSGSAPLDVTPAGFNARTRVHEYGGGAAVVQDGITYSSNMADQRLYRHAPGTTPAPLTPAGVAH